MTWFLQSQACVCEEKHLFFSLLHSHTHADSYTTTRSAMKLESLNNPQSLQMQTNTFAITSRSCPNGSYLPLMLISSQFNAAFLFFALKSSSPSVANRNQMSFWSQVRQSDKERKWAGRKKTDIIRERENLISCFQKYVYSLVACGCKEILVIQWSGQMPRTHTETKSNAK